MKLRNKDVTDISMALRQLDPTKDNEFKFTGKTRLAIGKKLRIASEHAQDLEKVRTGMVEAAGLGKTRIDSKGDTVPDDDPAALQKFNNEYRDLMNADVELEIGKFLEADLDFETNTRLGGSLIAALLPIITLKAE